MIKKESLPDRPKFCRSMSAVRHLFWRLHLRIFTYFTATIYIPQIMYIFSFGYDNIGYISIIPQRKISFLKLSKYYSWLTYDCSKFCHHVMYVNMLKLYKIKLFILCCYLLWNQDWLTYKCTFKSCTALIHLELNETFQMEFLHDCMLTADNFNIPPSFHSIAIKPLITELNVVPRFRIP